MMPENKPMPEAPTPPNNSQLSPDQIPSQPIPPQGPQPMAVTQPAGDKADPKNRLAMMAFAFFAAPTGLARAYIGETSGLVRLWLYIGSSFLMIIPFINLLAGLALLVLGVWGVVDFFLLRNRRVDSLGNQMHSTNRDERIIRYLFIAFIVLMALMVIGFIIGIFFSIMAGSVLSELNGNQSFNTSPFDSSADSFDSFEY